MFNILLADDEPLIRKGLKSIINDNFTSFNIAGEVSDGLEALKLLEQSCVDILISDIRMPFKDGMELVKEIHEKYPRIFTVILSGYDDFEYAQMAIKYKVYEYLLKPIETNELVNLMKRLENDLKSRNRLENNIEYLNLHYSGNISSLFSIVHEKDLLLNIKLFNTREVSNTINSLFTHLKNNNYNLYSIQQFSMELINLISNTILSHFGDKKLINTIVTNFLNIVKMQNSADDIQSLLFQNISFLIENLQNQKGCAVKDETIEKVKKYINENYYKNITLNLLSEKFYLNPSYLSDLFKSLTNENFLDYLTKVRLEKSFELMKDRELKIHEIAQLVGYVSEKHFIRIFKKLTGITPGEYRRNMYISDQ